MFDGEFNDNQNYQSICLIYHAMYARISHLHSPLPHPLAGGDDIE